MLLSVIDKLKTGSIKNVVPFGTRDMPNVPYVVVREDPDIAIGTTYFITVHYPPSNILDLRTYVRSDLLDLLDGFKTSAGTATNVMDSAQIIGPIVTNNDDGSISQERQFILTERYF